MSDTPSGGPLRKLYAEAWVAAVPHARHAIAAMRKDDDDDDLDVTAGLVGNIDWDAWTPGDPQGADLPDSLGALVDDADMAMRGINGTTLDRLASLLADGIRTGTSTDDIAASINGLLGDADRAYMIATTEVTRAMTAASLNTYTQAGITWKRFLTAEDPIVCIPCTTNEDTGAVPITGEFPNGDSPVHPVCRCTVLPADGPDD